MIIGLADTFGQVLLPELASVVVYAVMALVLLWRPQGLFGKA
jgi:branched-chain amino acid transport system permease protein